VLLLPSLLSLTSHGASQANQTIVEIKNLFETIGRDYPNLDPKVFVDNLARTLDQLLSDTLGQANTFESLASFTDVQKLSTALPGVLDAVTTAVPELQGMALKQLPGPIVGGKPGSEVLRQIDQVGGYVHCGMAGWTYSGMRGLHTTLFGLMSLWCHAMALDCCAACTGGKVGCCSAMYTVVSCSFLW
jgi:hypothetical protein